MNGDLIRQKNLLQQQFKSVKIPKVVKHKVGFTPIEIDFEGSNITFLINTDTDNFNQHFQDATNYIYSRRKSRVHLSVIKNWYIEWYRALGFNCVPK